MTGELLEYWQHDTARSDWQVSTDSVYTGVADTQHPHPHTQLLTPEVAPGYFIFRWVSSSSLLRWVSSSSWIHYILKCSSVHTAFKVRFLWFSCLRRIDLFHADACKVLINCFCQVRYASTLFLQRVNYIWTKQVQNNSFHRIIISPHFRSIITASLICYM